MCRVRHVQVTKKLVTFLIETFVNQMLRCQDIQIYELIL